MKLRPVLIRNRIPVMIIIISHSWGFLSIYKQKSMGSVLSQSIQNTRQVCHRKALLRDLRKFQKCYFSSSVATMK